MKKIFFIICFALLGVTVRAQDRFRDSLIAVKGFQAYEFTKGGDTIHFYVHHTGKGKPLHLVLFLNGSEPQPLFTYAYEKGKLKSYYWGPGDFRLLGDDYAYVVIAKPGIAGIFNEAVATPTPAAYLEKNSLEYRVWLADQVINYCRKRLLAPGGRVIVYGHSEGYKVVARLLTVNRHITQAGLWAGSALPDYQDFMLFKRKEVLQGKVSDSLAARQLDTLLVEYKGLFAAPDKRTPGSIYTNKRWISYARGSLEDLRKVNIPIYVLAATKDDNAPFEDAYIVPLEFIRLGKTNLTWKVCVGGDHGFNVTKANGERVNDWSDYFKDFIAWAGTHGGH